ANAVTVLEAAGLRDRFEVVVDGLVAADEGIPGKPAPDTYLRGAELLGVPAEHCVVIEDAVSGVQAGAAGGFATVVGVDRGAGRARRRRSGRARARRRGGPRVTPVPPGRGPVHDTVGQSVPGNIRTTYGVNLRSHLEVPEINRSTHPVDPWRWIETDPRST